MKLFTWQLLVLQITLGPRETDSYNQLILVSDQTQHTLGRKLKFGACQMR